MNITSKPGQSTSVEWSGSTKMHCITNSDSISTFEDISVKPVAMDACFNVDLPDGGRVTMIITFKDLKEIDTFAKFLKQQYKELNRAKNV